jgi:hypothetical protein
MTTYGNEGRLLEPIIHFSSFSIYDFNDSMPHFLSPRIRSSSYPSNTTLDLSLFVHKVTFISRRSQQHKLSVSLHHSARAFSRFQGGHWCCALYIGFFVCQEEGFFFWHTIEIALHTVLALTWRALVVYSCTHIIVFLATHSLTASLEGLVVGVI